MLEQLNVATYKGVRFHCNDTTTTAGRSKVIHRFANSDKNNLEDQGLDPRRYELTAIIFGENYLTDRDELLAKIEEDGPGVLNHPFYGRIENAVAMPVTFSETVKKLGRLEIPITFEISDSSGIPSVTQLSSSGITNRKEGLLDSVSEDFSNTYKVTESFDGNFNASKDKLDLLGAALGDNVSITSISSQSSASYRARLDTFLRGINTLVGEPEILGVSITGLINAISTLYDTPEQTLDVSRRFFTFGDDDVPIVESTAGLIERSANNTAINEAVVSSSLAVAYEAAGLIDFRTVDEVDSTSRALEQVYRGLRG